MVAVTKAGRYEILDELGRGGMGVVYRAKDPSIGRIVAVKTIQISEEGTGLSHAQLLERFQTEARAAGALAHSNIVVIYDVGESDGVYYITMELVNGKSLQSLMDAGEKFPLFRVVRIMEQACSALQYAHDHQVVHRDIKPANIMLTGEDFVKITDFGTAQIMQYGAAQQTSAMGTPGYMSPEQIKGRTVDGRTDIFSLGVILYQLTTGQKPFRGQDIATILYQILNEEPPAPHVLNPNLPPGVGSTIMKALSKSPHLRYENCRELLDDLKYYRPGAAPGGENPPPAAEKTPLSPVREKSLRDTPKNLQAEMPRIPGVEPRPKQPALSPSVPISASGGVPGNNVPLEPAHQPEGIYAGPAAKSDATSSLIRLAKIAAAVLIAAMLASWAVKMVARMQHPESDTSLVTRDSSNSSNQPASQLSRTPQASQAKPLVSSAHAIGSDSEIATLNELTLPWSSKGFVFRNPTQSKYVPAIIVRLPGPASLPNSYWAFSLEAPFSQCQLDYIDNPLRLSREYGFESAHPMVVNPCTRSVYDPLQHKELPGNILVRGAVVSGHDLRPPFGIELKITGNHIHAIAME